jgi:hypothetical protein
MSRSVQVLSLVVLTLAFPCATTGCKTCDVPTHESSASGALTYTESVAAQDARVRRIDDATLPAVAAVNLARGRGRITGERRVPDDLVSSWVIGGVRTITVQSTLSAPIENSGLPEQLSWIELRITRPEQGDPALLQKLDAVICDHVVDGAAQCTGARGTIDFHPREGGFTADVQLEAVGASETDATLAGNLHLELEEGVETKLCPDLS